MHICNFLFLKFFKKQTKQNQQFQCWSMGTKRLQATFVDGGNKCLVYCTITLKLTTQHALSSNTS